MSIPPICSPRFRAGSISSCGSSNPMSHRDDSMKTLSVLVVEDDPIVGALLGETLEAMGYSVCAIEETEADAVNSAARCHPDLMIVDVRLGDGNGVSAVEEITRAGPIPHVFVS